MLTRAWILDVLATLPVWAWPVFVWELCWFGRYYRAWWADNPAGILGVGVTPAGRIIITLEAAGDTPDPADWTRHAPRAPWAALDPDALAALIEALGHPVRTYAGIRLCSGFGWAVPAPAILDSG